MASMRFRYGVLVAPLACIGLFVFLSTLCAQGATIRPNSLDRRVDSLSSTRLLTQPAVALVDGDRQLAAQRLEQLELPGFFVAILAQIVALAYFWQSGAAARVRDRLRRILRNEFVARLAFGAALGAVARLASLIPEAYIYRVGRVMQLNDQLLRAWLADWLVNTLVTMFLTGVVVALVLWLVDRTHQWYIYTTVAIFAVSFMLEFIGPFAISPFFNRYAALPRGAAATVAQLERKAGLNVPVVVQTRSGTHLGGAYFEGLGPTKRIVLSPTELAVARLDELRFVIAYQLGFIAIGAAARIALANAVFLVFGVAIAVGVADRIGFRRDDDPVSRLALVAALMGVLYLVVSPMHDAMQRRLSNDADAYAIALTGDRAAAVRSIVRDTDQRLANACPQVMTRIFLSRIPDPSTRIATINRMPSGCP